MISFDYGTTAIFITDRQIGELVSGFFEVSIELFALGEFSLVLVPFSLRKGDVEHARRKDGEGIPLLSVLLVRIGPDVPFYVHQIALLPAVEIPLVVEQDWKPARLPVFLRSGIDGYRQTAELLAALCFRKHGIIPNSSP